MDFSGEAVMEMSVLRKIWLEIVSRLLVIAWVSKFKATQAWWDDFQTP